LIPLLAPMVGGLLHGAYVVYIGGDFMSGRLLLPSVFAVAAPVGVATVSWRPCVAVGSVAAMGAVATVLVWSIVCGTSLRLPYPDVGPFNIFDERNFYRHFTGSDHPTVAADYRRTVYGEWTALGIATAKRDRRELCFTTGTPARCLTPTMTLAPRWHARGAIVVGNLGAVGALVPTDLLVVDPSGLADPVAARVRLYQRGRPGHEKVLSVAWITARFADTSSPLADGIDRGEVLVARRVLHCGDLGDVDEAATGPLTLGRIWDNATRSLSRMTLRFSPSPFLARDELCRPSG
jgi:arabinofuranosyltransferase